MLRFEPLDRRHDRKGFRCGEAALDGYLHTTARQHAEKGISRTFVAVDVARPTRVVGYFTLTVAEIDRVLLPAAQKRRLPESVLPVIKLARLAVDRDYQGQGTGGVLLFEALQRAATAQALTGSVAVVVEAKHPKAAAFYAHFGFVPAPDDELSLFMGFEPIRALIQANQALMGGESSACYFR